MKSDTPRTDKAADHTAPEKLHRLCKQLEREARDLSQQVGGFDRLTDGLQVQLNTSRHECKLMAMLAAKTPQFFNPLVAIEAEKIRDRILQEND